MSLAAMGFIWITYSLMRILLLVIMDERDYLIMTPSIHPFVYNQSTIIRNIVMDFHVYLIIDMRGFDVVSFRWQKDENRMQKIECNNKMQDFVTCIEVVF